MDSKIKFITAMDMLFLLLLALSGSTLGITSEIFYYLAFLGPVGLTLNYIYNPGKNQHVSPLDVRKAMLNDLRSDFTLSKDKLAFTLPVIAPAISVVLAFSVLTTFILALFGQENAVNLGEPFVIALLTHALVPAVLEELLFRFVPIKLLSENKKVAFVISSVMFAFAHANLFQIPYALIAGAIFSWLYISTGSIIPSIILHFLNNTVSLISIYGCKPWIILVTLGVFSLASAIFLFMKRETYKEKTKEIFDCEKASVSYYPLFFIGTSLILAISMFFD